MATTCARGFDVNTEIVVFGIPLLVATCGAGTDRLKIIPPEWDKTDFKVLTMIDTRALILRICVIFFQLCHLLLPTYRSSFTLLYSFCLFSFS